MPEKKLKALLSQLQEILDKIDRLDPETRDMVAALEDDIERLLDAEDDSVNLETFREGVQSLETRFRADHPVAERFLREIIDILAKVGI